MSGVGVNGQWYEKCRICGELVNKRDMTVGSHPDPAQRIVDPNRPGRFQRFDLCRGCDDKRPSNNPPVFVFENGDRVRV